jgi:hypothetical protein
MAAPLFLFAKSMRRGTHGTKPRQQPPSAWQASFNPSQPDLPALAKLSSTLSDLEYLLSAIWLWLSAKWL